MNIETIRKTHLINEIAVIDGQPGCGKTLFNSLCSYLDRFEVMQYSPYIENVLALKDLGKLENDACRTMLEIEIDLQIYESMMSRNSNFRYRDLSSVLRNKQFLKYLKRLFQKGNEFIPDRIKKEKPILHLCTHNLLSYSKPFFESYPEKLKFLEVVRHPLYQVIQMSLNYETLEKTDNSRFFYLNIKRGVNIIPFWAKDWDAYNSLNYVDKAINEIYYMTKRTQQFKESFNLKNLLTVSFENFVKDPLEDLEKIKAFFNSEFRISESKALKLQNVPRKKVADGIPAAIYKRCGWVPGDKNLDELGELQKRRDFIINQGASDDSVSKIDELSSAYIEKHPF